MTLTTTSFTTGPSVLPDVGLLSYNGCVFSPLFETRVSGLAVKDNATRTVKYMEYTITVDGYVTLPTGQPSISPTMVTLRQLLTTQGGALVYQGRGMDLNVNTTIFAAGVALPSARDVAWGPVPELLEFQPLGGGLSAKVRWQVKTRLPEMATQGRGLTAAKGRTLSTTPGGGLIGAGRGGLAALPLLQFNYETVVTYNEDGYSTLSVNGTLEIAQTRSAVGDKTVPRTADDMRGVIEARVMPGIDLTRFHVVKREFKVSRDKRTLEWSIQANEKPYMDLPIGCMMARGTFSFRPARAGMGLATWLCTLRATYTVRHDAPRRLAWDMFLALLRLRMNQSNVPPNADLKLGSPPAPPRAPGTGPIGKVLTAVGGPGVRGIMVTAAAILKESSSPPTTPTTVKRKAWIIDFTCDEGLYLDSKTTAFSATWRLIAPFTHILLASGLWKKVEGKDRTLWATTMRDVQGASSWLPNRVDPTLDIIVDFGT